MMIIRLKSYENDYLHEYFLESYEKQSLTDCIIYCSITTNDTDDNVDDQDDQDDNDPTTSHNNNTGQSMNRSTIKYRQFHCHRLLLSTYSKFFRKHFVSNESILNQSSISSIFIDIPSKIMGKILKLIYHGHIDLNDDDDDDDFTIKKNELSIGLMKLGIDDIIVDNGINTTVQSNSKSIQTKSISGDNLLKKRLLDESSNDQSSTVQLLPQQPHSSRSLPIHSPKRMMTTMDTSVQMISMNKQPKSIQNRVIDDNLLLQPQPQPQQQQQTEVFTCRLCRKQYNYEISLKKHMKNAHCT